MQVELEAKFLHCNHNQVRNLLIAHGATLVQPERLMRRKVYDFADATLSKKGSWVRVRDESDKVTMSFKHQLVRSLHGTTEVNLLIDNFHNAHIFLTELGLIEKSYQETKRETWQIGSTQIELDTWPWIDPFVEIEGATEADIKLVAQQLNLNWSGVTHGDVTVAYQDEYDITGEEIGLWPEIKFYPTPMFFQSRRRTRASK